MKCIHCGNDSTYPQRSANGKKCTTCHHPFAFEPRTDPLSVSDALFQKCIQEVSSEETLKFTEHQLYYEFARRTQKKSVHIPEPFGWSAACLGAGGIVGAAAGFPLLIPCGIAAAIVACVVGANVGKKKPQTRVVKTLFGEFHRGYLSPWVETHGKIQGLLPELPRKRVLFSSEPPPGAPDIMAYSFDRALIVERAEVAAMLVANRFHFENNCAILSLDKRFPTEGRFDLVLDMLRRNPRLIVFALHNASLEGMTMVSSLRDPDWFPDPTIRIADIGLRPRHAQKSALLLNKRDPQTLPPEVRAVLDKSEASWLEDGFVAGLEVMRPARLMRAIYQAFSQMVTVGPDGTLILVNSGPGIWVGDGYGSETGIYAADSFG